MNRIVLGIVLLVFTLAMPLAARASNGDGADSGTVTNVTSSSAEVGRPAAAASVSGALVYMGYVALLSSGISLGIAGFMKVVGQRQRARKASA